MSQPDPDDIDFDAALTLQDYVEVISADIDEAEENLSADEILRLGEVLQEKLASVMQSARARDIDNDVFVDIGYQRRG